MNKVSPQNKDKLVQKSLAIFVPAYASMYCDVLWALIQRPVQIYQPIYAEMARAIAMSTPMPEKLAFKSAWETCWGGISFVDLPADFSDVSKEDVFHEWSIWKKTRINLAIGCVFLCYRGVFTEPAPLLLAPLVVCVDNALIEPPAVHVLDYWLDILGAIWGTLKETQQPLPHIEKLTDWAHGFTVPKCRFKVEKFIESYKNERPDSKRPRHHASQGAPRS